MTKPIIVTVVIVLLLCKNIGPVYATIINFDDLNQGIVPSGYAGLTWGTSILSRPYADSTSFSANNDSGYSTPHSTPFFIVNGYGVPDLWFEFPAPVIFRGAWFTAANINKWAAEKIRFIDNLGNISNWQQLTNSPQYLAAMFYGSTKIYVQPSLVFDGNQVIGGWYTMDDIHYESFSNPSTHSFSITIAGTGSGAVNSAPSGYIACAYQPQTGTCTSILPSNTSFTLTASPSDDSQLINWQGACAGCYGLSCDVTIDSDKSCIVTINILPLVRLAGPSYFSNVTKAYSKLPEGESATIQAQAVEFKEDVDLNSDIPLTLIGGYDDSSFSTRNGYTILHGAMTIKRGSGTVDRIILR